MSGKINTYRDLIVWRKAIELTRLVYRLTREASFPTDERYGIVNQMRRASVSVPSNIAEGQARRTTKEFVQFLYIAKGSLAELDTQSTISRDLAYLTQEQYQTVTAKIDELQRMLFSLIGTLQTRKRR